MQPPRDRDPGLDEFRRHGHQLIDWIAEYLTKVERYPVAPVVIPGDVRRALPPAAPDQGESLAAIFADFERVLVPALTHWNHPGFLAYFATTGSPPGILAELLSAALNQQAMLWRTSPAATELEEVALGWLRDLLGLPAAFEGVIYDTASISTVHALATARDTVLNAASTQRGGNVALADLRVYCSEHAHSSIDKAVRLIGLGREALRRIAVDADFRMRADALAAAIDEDRRAGLTPAAIVATIGTTSTTSADPVQAIAAIAARESIWLHVDAAYAGVAAMLPSMQFHFAGWQAADSIVVNPHKWLFVPFDLSAFYCRRMDALRRTFSLGADYLQRADGARDLMDTGVQLGRRFRALKLWMVLRYFGADHIRTVLSHHIALAGRFAEWVDADPRFERLAPVPFSVVCFRALHAQQSAEFNNDLNLRLLERVNATGQVYLSHTRIRGVVALRLAIAHMATDERHISRAWQLLRQHTDQLLSPDSA